MVGYKSSSKPEPLSDKHDIVLPIYKLDSNLVLLPGIIYNVTFSRFKAAALLSRFKEKTNSIPVINNLLNEYDFNEENTDQKGGVSNPFPISKEVISGIEEYYKYEQVFTKNASSSIMKSKELKDFDWFVLAVTPNLDKVKAPVNSQLAPESSNVVTIVKITGISDDSTSIRLSLKAVSRGLLRESVKSQRPNEKLIEINWNPQVSNLPTNFERFSGKILKLLNAIDDFISDYRNALSSATDKNNKKAVDLLALNPLANALYLQLLGSKDFSKAYSSLQKLVKASISDESIKRDELAFLRLVDFTSAIMPFPNHEKLALLSTTDPVARVDEINNIMEKLYQVLLNLKSNNFFVTHWFENEATNVQKANLVASQLKSIRLVLEDLATNKNIKNGSNSNLIRRTSNSPVYSKPSNINDQSNKNVDEDDDESDDDDLSAIAHFIKNVLPNISSLSKDSKRLILKDYKRIKSSPPGNSDYHVIRNYLDIVADIPWDKYITIFKSNQEIDLNIARKQLDEDHYGLENVKKRLIQYLVVLKLLGMNAEKTNDKHLTESQSKVNSKENTNNESIVIADDALHDASKNRNTTSSISKKSEFQKSLLTTKKNKSPIIMLSGPPGIGKTSLARSIARSLGRNFQRISLGGVKDESEIRGHRRTYVGAMPGLLVQSLRKARSMNPVILLDEIDKVVGGNSTGNRFNGDPSAALLEVLDPEQNNSFIDHYLGFPIDLSQVIFICTANEPHNLSKPLLDRLEMIELDAYDVDEKLIIGEKYLLPRQISRNGFPSQDLIRVDNKVMKKIIIDYTREAGVRNLERRLGMVCRHKAVEYAKSLDTKISYNPTVSEFHLSKYLGVPYPNLSSEVVDTPTKLSKYGVVNGLSYNSDGSGSVLIFESIGFSNSSEKLNMTGRLGEVLSESAKIGLTFVKSIIFNDLLNLGDTTEALISKFKNLEIHLHVPAGSISKDGPSAGITMALSFLSLILEKPVPNDIAMTGEITLRGMVLPIGGLKEKLFGAHLAGIKRVIVPRANRRDLIEQYVKATNDDTHLHELLKDNESKYNFKNRDPEIFILQKLGIQIYYASEFWDVIKIVWGDNLLMKLDQTKAIEYHL